MSNTSTQWILELRDNISSQLNVIDKHLQESVGHTNEMNQSLKKMSAIDLYAIANSFQQINQSLQAAIAPGVKFQDGLKDVEAITGVTGDALDSLGLKARKSAKEFGGSAADSLDTYKVILSRLGPDIANSEEALAGMEKNARILSKTMNNDLTAATDALTTAMLQYKVDLNAPIEAQKEMTNMMNIMAAGAKYGSAEVTDISAAIKVAGVQAKLSNLSFSETNAALQELARGGKQGAEAGTALRNVLGKMAGEDVLPQKAIDKLNEYGVNMNIVSDTTLPFTERLRELKKAQGDSTIMAQMFGVENQAAAQILLGSIDAQDELVSKIEDTNTAFEQAEIKMSSYSEKMSRFKAQFEDIGISLFDITKNIAPVVSVGAQAGMVYANLTNVMNVFKGLTFASITKSLTDYWTQLKLTTKATWDFIKAKAAEGWQFIKNMAFTGVGAVVALGAYIGSLISATAAQWGLNVAMSANPIGLFVIGLLAIVAVITAMYLFIKKLIQKWDEWGKYVQMVLAWIFPPLGFLIGLIKSIIDNWDNVKAAFKDGGFIEGIKAIGKVIFNAILIPVQTLLELLTNIPGLDNIAGKGLKAVEELRAGLFPKEEKSAGDFAGKGQLGSKRPRKEKEKPTNPFELDFTELDDVLTPPSGDPNKPNDNGISGTGGGAGKSITMSLDIKNYFNVDGNTNVEILAEQIIGKINDKLRDAVVALG